MKEINLGSDEGIVKVVISGKTLDLCPGTVIEQINQMIGPPVKGPPDPETGMETNINPKSKGMPFIETVREWLAVNHQVSPVSFHKATEFYDRIVEAAQEIEENFSQRPASSTTTELTPAASGEATS